jgi:hypothetical protein
MSSRSLISPLVRLALVLALGLLVSSAVGCTEADDPADDEPTETTDEPSDADGDVEESEEAAPDPEPSGSAEYELVFEAVWSETTHPDDYPSNPHFSGLIGAAHREDVRLWQEGGMSSPGMKNMAETGGKSPLDEEIEALIDDDEACELVSGGGINPSPGRVSVTFEVTGDCPIVSVVSMIAPSPDWFVGVSALELWEDGEWAERKVVELLPYDAGTDSGSSYASANKATADPESIRLLEEEPVLVDGALVPFGTFTFTRLD